MPENALYQIGRGRLFLFPGVMADLDQKDRLFYSQAIRSALSLQSEHHDRWKQSLDFLRLRWFDRNGGLQDTERTEVHYVWAYYNTLIPTLYARDPHIFVKPRRASSTPFSDTMDEVLNYLKDELKLKKAVQSSIADTVPYGMGWIEVGYTPDPDTLRASHADRKPSFAQEIKKSIDSLFNPPVDERAEGQLLPDVRVGKVFLRWWPAFRVLLAPGYHDISEMPYLIVVEDVAVEEFHSNPRYNPSVAEAVKPTRTILDRAGKVLSPNPAISRHQAPRMEGDFKFVRVYHIHDRRSMRKVGFAEGHLEELYNESWGMSFDEFGLVPLVFNDTPPSDDDAYAYPMDDITPGKPQLIEKSLLRTSMIKARRRMAPIIIVDRNLYTPEQWAQLQESEEALIIGLTGGAQGFTPVHPVTLPPDIFRIDGTIDRDLDTVFGFNQLLMSGASQPGVDTATEAQLTVQGSNMRASRKVDIIEQFIVEIARRLAACSWEHMDRDDIAELLGKPVSEEMWPDVQEMNEAERSRMIRSELSFRIEAGSTQPEQIRMVELNLWIRMVNMLKAAFPDRFHDGRLVEQMLKKAGMKELEYVVKMDDEAEKAHAQQENQLLLANMPQLVGPNDMDEIHLMEHGVASQQGSTDALDAHILAHAQNRQRKNPALKPQKGDVTSPQKAAVPELQRTGGEDFADMLGATAGNSTGMGPENSMRPA